MKFSDLFPDYGKEEFFGENNSIISFVNNPSVAIPFYDVGFLHNVDFEYYSGVYEYYSSDLKLEKPKEILKKAMDAHPELEFIFVIRNYTQDMISYRMMCRKIANL